MCKLDRDVWTIINEKIEKMSDDKKVDKALHFVSHYIKCCISWCHGWNYKVIKKRKLE